MTIASLRSCSVLLALLSMGVAGPGASASDRTRTTASVTVAPSARVTIINSVVKSAPLQTLLLMAAIAPAGVVFAAPSSSPGTVAVGSAGGGTRGAGAAAPGGGAGLAAEGGADGPELVVIGGSVDGTTIDGDAVSVSVGDVSAGSAAGSARVPMVIAQFN